LDVSPRLKATSHASDGEPANGVDDQNQFEGVEGKAFGSI
jgi:hypothetical protein